MRARCPSEITIFSYLFWFPDQAREVLIFASKQSGHLFHTVYCQFHLLSEKLQVGGCRLVQLPWPTTALSSHFPAGLTKKQSNASHRLGRIYPSFLHHHLVFTLGLRVLGCNGVRPTKCSVGLGHQNSLLGICSGKCASTSYRSSFSPCLGFTMRNLTNETQRCKSDQKPMTESQPCTLLSQLMKPLNAVLPADWQLYSHFHPRTLIMSKLQNYT